MQKNEALGGRPQGSNFNQFQAAASAFNLLEAFSHPDFTVGAGISPAQPHLQLVDLPFGITTGRELAGDSSLTLPRRSTVRYLLLSKSYTILRQSATGDPA